MSVEQTGDLSAFLSTIKRIAQKSVIVGVPGDIRHGGGEENHPMTVSELAYVHEFGTNTGLGGHVPIPPRPFLNPGMTDAQDMCAAYLSTGFAAAIDARNPAIAEAALEEAGLHAVNRVKYQFTSNSWIELSDATLSARRRRGRTGENPLLDTGQLRNSITYMVIG